MVGLSGSILSGCLTIAWSCQAVRGRIDLCGQSVHVRPEQRRRSARGRPQLMLKVLDGLKMRSIVFLLSAFALVCLTGIQGAVRAQEPTRVDTTAIYAAVLDSVSRMEPTDILLVRDLTIGGRGLMGADEGPNGPSRLQLSTDPSGKIRRDGVSLPPSFPIDYGWVTDQEFEDALAGSVTYDAVAVAVVGMSWVVFEEDGDAASVFLERWCGGVCGWGAFVYLDRREDGWRVSAINRAWAF